MKLTPWRRRVHNIIRAIGFAALVAIMMGASRRVQLAKMPVDREPQIALSPTYEQPVFRSESRANAALQAVKRRQKI